MGVPVVTLSGRTHASRVGASLLASVGLGRLVCDTVDSYVLAAQTAMTEACGSLQSRAALRERVRGSPLCDGAGHTRAFEDALLDLWRPTAGC
ncbi:MAG: hypothetical protein IT434_06800 [Phycisphaerales bacterium]|nr:hypothetical protein [Phycisphaerales bacterium]